MNRKMIGVRFLAAAISSCLLLCAGAAQTLKLPPHEKITLKNGMTVLLMEKRGVPMVSFAAIVKAGSTADPAGEEGLASVTAGLLRNQRVAGDLRNPSVTA